MDRQIIPRFTSYLRRANDYELINHHFPSPFYLVRDIKSRKYCIKKTVQFEPDDIVDKYLISEIILFTEFQIDGLPFLKLEGFNFPKADEEGFIVTEYVEGVSLSRLIENQFNECSDIPTTKMIIIYGIAFALKLIHSKSAYHGYLNPHNIIINEQKEPIITDFGNLYRINTENDHFHNEYMYQAPELLSQEYGESDESYEKNPSSYSDVYSFAMLLFQILFGRFTYHGNQMRKLPFISHVLNGKRFDMPDSDEVPKKFIKLITNCWSQKPSERGTMEDIIKSLESENLVLKGCNMDVYHKYIQRLKTNYDQQEQDLEQNDDDTQYFEF